VLSSHLLAALSPARVLAVHVTARPSVIGHRLHSRTDPASRQLSAQFHRGEMTPSIFAPPNGVDAVVTIDTSDHAAPDTTPIEAAIAALLR
jgi:hypothetical protein